MWIYCKRTDWECKRNPISCAPFWCTSTEECTWMQTLTSHAISDGLHNFMNGRGSTIALHPILKYYFLPGDRRLVLSVTKPKYLIKNLATILPCFLHFRTGSWWLDQIQSSSLIFLMLWAQAFKSDMIGWTRMVLLEVLIIVMNFLTTSFLAILHCP